MRHLNAGRKLNRSASHRRALFRNLVTALFERESIRTTDAKAKEARRLAERMITLGKDGSLAARRRALSFIQSRKVVARLFAEIAPRFKDRNGGYTRIIKVGIRHGDAAPVSVLQLTTMAADVRVVSAPSADPRASRVARGRSTPARTRTGPRRRRTRKSADRSDSRHIKDFPAVASNPAPQASRAPRRRAPVSCLGLRLDVEYPAVARPAPDVCRVRVCVDRPDKR